MLMIVAHFWAARNDLQSDIEIMFYINIEWVLMENTYVSILKYHMAQKNIFLFPIQ